MALKDHAEALREVVKERGEMPLEEAREWLTGQGDDNPNGTIGAPIRWGWWHKSADGTSLVAGRVPSKAVKTKETDEPPSELESLEDPADQMEAIARQLAIPPKTARAIATYVTRSFDVDNPEQVWAALKEVTEIGPSQRKRLWRTWTSWRGVEPPEELVQRVEQDNVQEAKGAARGDGAHPTPRFVAVDGEVVPADPDDPGGMPFSQALQAARLQVEKGRSGQGDDGVLSTLITESGQNTRQIIEKLDRGSQPPDTSDLLGKVVDAKLESQRLAFSADIREITATLRALANHDPPKSAIDQLFDAIPGLKDRFLKMFEPPAPSTDSGVRVTLPEAKDADGNPVGVDLESYERLENIRLKKDALRWGRETMPELLRVGAKMVKTWDRLAEQGQIPQGKAKGAKQDDDLVETDCIKCSLPLNYRKGAEAFQCPNCMTTQAPDGRVIMPGPERQPEPVGKKEEEPQPVASAPRDEGEEGAGADQVVDEAEEVAAEAQAETEEPTAEAPSEPAQDKPRRRHRKATVPSQ